MRKLVFLGIFSVLALAATGCSPKVGSDAWCKKMDNKPRGDWTMSEMQDYTRYCILKEKE